MLTVRRGAPADLELIVRHNQAVAFESEGLALDLDTLRRGASPALHGEVDAFYLLAEQDGLVLGQLMITTEWSDWRASVVWWIQSVYVVPSARRWGVYRRLHEAARDEAVAAGAAGLRLYVDRHNQAAMAVYRAVGMDGDHYRVFEQMFEGRR